MRPYDGADHEAVSLRRAGGSSSGGGSSNGSGNSSSAGSDSVRVSGAEHGDVRIRPSRPSRGDTVTITVTPDRGYVLDRLTVVAKDGDLVLIVGDAKEEVVFAALGALRVECAKQLGLLDPKDFRFLWVTQFPMFEWSEEEGRYQAMHHPFTAPMAEDEDKLLTDKKNCRARAYDIVLNGTELGGGSIRINTPELQTKAFEALGLAQEDIQERFGHLVNAFQYGAPPHGGLAYGLDRLVMLMTGATSIRDVIAFPKVQNASDLMMDCPDVVDDKQLDDLSIAVTRQEGSEE